MIRIAITPEDIRDYEPLYIQCVLDAGWDWVHLRHPALNKEQMRSLIESIDPKYYPRLKSHSHPRLVLEYGLGGFHLNSRIPEVGLDPKPFSLSRSCHTLDEVASAKNSSMDYVTLSPIFDSVSKAGYLAAFSPEELTALPSTPRVIALGGVTPERLPQLGQYQFAGYAVLGYLAKAKSIEQLKTLLSEFN